MRKCPECGIEYMGYYCPECGHRDIVDGRLGY